ncbi:MAG: NAD-dependent epimerase/dehydratase family protein, partial [Actinomycetota bacterium]
VTGGAGFIGSTLVDRLLAEGHAVDVIDDLSTGTLANLAEARADRTHEIRFHHADIRLPEVAALIGRRRPEVVFHLAAPTGQAATVDAEVNVVGTVNVLDGARAGGSAKVVFASTHGGRSVRTVAKAAAVEYLTTYREVFDLEFTALALASVYGPRQRAGEVAAFATRAASGEPCTIAGDGEQTRDFVYIDDVVDAFVRAAGRGSGLVCDIGTGVATSVNRLHSLIATEAPVHEPAPAEPPGAPADPSRAGIYLGWKPWTSLEDGLRATLAG